jgi:hypothetical protein
MRVLGVRRESQRRPASVALVLGNRPGQSGLLLLAARNSFWLMSEWRRSRNLVFGMRANARPARRVG